MAKAKTVYACTECGYTSARWLGKCPACQSWDTLQEERIEPAPAGGSKSPRGTGKPVPVPDVKSDATARTPTGVADLDRILGGGLVAGSTLLVGGEPGVGKSTLLLQVAHWLADAGLTVLYVTAEESAMQIKLRAERLACLHPDLLVFAENDLDAILGAAEADGIGAVIVDSIQMVHWAQLTSAPGSVGQVRECAASLIAQAKRRHVPLFLVGHVTKEGTIAGPKVLEHMVDVVLSFEGDRFHAARVLRAMKNRFGAINEIGVFEMGAQGLRPIADPSTLFLSGRRDNAPGTVVTAPLEGSRPFLVEVQALAASGQPGSARRRFTGVDAGRASMLLAVLEKRCGLAVSDQDVFLNVVGGAACPEPGTDLALLLAVAGSLRERLVPEDTLVLGEVGLGGEVRPVTQLEPRLEEGRRLGFRHALVPTQPPRNPGKLDLHIVPTVEAALDWLSA